MTAPRFKRERQGLAGDVVAVGGDGLRHLVRGVVGDANPIADREAVVLAGTLNAVDDLPRHPFTQQLGIEPTVEFDGDIPVRDGICALFRLPEDVDVPGTEALAVDVDGPGFLEGLDLVRP